MNRFLFQILLSMFAIAAFAQTVTDIDGNVYQTVVIGNQEWMAENLKVTHFRNGEAIPLVSDVFVWSAQNASARYCYYNNSTSNRDTYGNLYNWYTVDDNRGLAPEGWHIPSDEEWQTLANSLGGSEIAGGKMKTSGTSNWSPTNEGATNESGFSGLPAGWRNVFGDFFDLETHSYFWSSSVAGSGFFNGQARRLRNDNTVLFRADGGYDKYNAFAIRCVRDSLVSSIDNPAETVKMFTLYQNYPNPFNPATTIKYQLAQSGIVRLEVYDLLGRVVQVLVDGYKSKGLHQINFDAGDLSSGIYIYSLKSAESIQSRKFLLLE